MVIIKFIAIMTLGYEFPYTPMPKTIDYHMDWLVLKQPHIFLILFTLSL